MQRRSLLLPLVSLFFYSVNAQVVSSDASVSFEGFVTNSAGRYIENVHIVNISVNRGTTSNWEGQFKLTVFPGDTVRLTCVGYIPFHYNIPAQRQSPILPLHIVMHVDTIQLTGTEIYPWPADAKALKEAVLAMDEQTPKVPDLKLNEPIFYSRRLPVSYQQSSTPGMADPGLTYTIPGPISTLYEAYSKSAESRRKYELLVNGDQKKKLATSRYNVEVVKRVTSFRSDKDIQDFMLYCNLSVDFIVSSSEYNLYKAIHECLLAFNADREKED